MSVQSPCLLTSSTVGLSSTKYERLSPCTSRYGLFMGTALVFEDARVLVVVDYVGWSQFLGTCGF